MQSGDMAKRHFGYYSAREFDFSPFESVRSQVLELGRASIAREHRTSEVLTLLWRGITQYAQHHGLRYFLGCSSLGTTDPDGGWALYQQLQPFMARPQFHTIPTPAFELPPPMQSPLPTTKVPKLLKTYLAVGSRICGPPACDREFWHHRFLDPDGPGRNDARRKVPFLQHPMRIRHPGGHIARGCSRWLHNIKSPQALVISSEVERSQRYAGQQIRCPILAKLGWGSRNARPLIEDD